MSSLQKSIADESNVPSIAVARLLPAEPNETDTTPGFGFSLSNDEVANEDDRKNNTHRFIQQRRTGSDARLGQSKNDKMSKPMYTEAPEGYMPRFSKDRDHLIKIEPKDIKDEDVKCGRVNKGSTHPGNVEFNRVIKFHRNAYQGMGAQHVKKTRLRDFIVDKDFKGRFIGVDDEGIHYLLTEEKARTKVSQALREKNKIARKS
jgi:hypothetical protein